MAAERNIFRFLMVAAILFGCTKDIVAPDISNERIIINAPVNGLTLTSNEVTFWWSEIEGADKYNLQVVIPSFDSTQTLVLDTLVMKNKFTRLLQPNRYQWRVRAENTGSKTNYVMQSLTIDTSSNLGNQKVQLKMPLAGETTGNSTVVFSWDELKTALQYELRINQGAILDTVVNATKVTISLPVTAGTAVTFSWNVRALNGQGYSAFNETDREVTVDKKAPGTPALSKPFDGAFVTLSDTLVWLSGSGAFNDSIYVSIDSSFNTLSASALIEGGKVILAGFNLTPAVTGTQYWWRVMSIDKAGNKSAKSSRRRFTLLP